MQSAKTFALALLVALQMLRVQRRERLLPIPPLS
jgi:hypothetical protein